MAKPLGAVHDSLHGLVETRTRLKTSLPVPPFQTRPATLDALRVTPLVSAVNFADRGDGCGHLCSFNCCPLCIIRIARTLCRRALRPLPATSGWGFEPATRPLALSSAGRRPRQGSCCEHQASRLRVLELLRDRCFDGRENSAMNNQSNFGTQVRRRIAERECLLGWRACRIQALVSLDLPHM